MKYDNQRYTSMRTVAAFFFFLLIAFSAVAQSEKLRNKKYPSLLWEITKKGSSKPSYLFGTMHVSSKMVFHLSDSFYVGMKRANVVALETNPGNWQQDFSRYNLDGPDNVSYRQGGNDHYPQEYLSINTLKAWRYEKLLEIALSSNPSMINNFLYRNNELGGADFEEDTYLDLYIYQVGRKWNKKLTGVENFDESMKLMKEAYSDAAKDKKAKQRGYDIDADFSYSKMEEAYRTGNLDLLDTINKVNSRSDAFDEKFLYRRNEIQAQSIDSILKTGATLFVGVGAAHLPGERGVIEILRRQGYKLRPIKMTERDGRHKDAIEGARVPVVFSTQTSGDGVYSVSTPGKLYAFGRVGSPINQQQYADMGNGSYYMITRIVTNAGLWGHSKATVLRKIDSVLYENIPGKIISKKPIEKGGNAGFDVVNKTRRGDYQRYNIFVTPFEVLVFKMSGNGNYVRLGKEGEQFFNSIQLKSYSSEWKKYSPPFGGFSADMPEPFVTNGAGTWKFSGQDGTSSYEIIRTDVHNYRFAEEDSFDLNLMEESFASSDFIARPLERKQTHHQGYPALETKYKYKDSSTALVKFIIQGPHYYTLVANGRAENSKMKSFLQSFTLQPFMYPNAKHQSDTALFFTVTSPVALYKPKKLDMYPDDLYRYGGGSDDDATLLENGIFKDKVVENDSTGEKIYVSFFKPGRYFFDDDTTKAKDTILLKSRDEIWAYRNRKKYGLPNGMKVMEYELTDSTSSRMIKGKVFRKDGVSFKIVTYGDTLTKSSPFVQQFFSSFIPADTVKGTNPLQKKGPLFFSDFFSTDSLLHKKAIKNIAAVLLDSTDFLPLKNAIASLSWKEKKYLDVKVSFISKLGSISSKAASDYLKELYFSAVDTIDLQNSALESLLRQQTAYSFSLFKDIMVNEPPVLNVVPGNKNSYQTAAIGRPGTWNNDEYSNGYFFDNLYDSLRLTATIFKDLLPLMNITDYEQPVMRLLERLVDSNMVKAKDYEAYLPKLLLEAKQELKKQVISEKSKSIEKAQQDDGDEKEIDFYSKNNSDYGNSRLSSYATLLMPFWDNNPSVQTLLQQMLRSNDKRLKYNTALLFLQQHKNIPDTLLNYFASDDEYRFELYTSLKKLNKTTLFPASFNNHIALARSELLSTNSYIGPDTAVYLQRLPVTFKGKSGYVYFFKYRAKKESGVWKIALAGMVPANEKQYQFEVPGDNNHDDSFDFTDLTNTKLDADEPLEEQLWKVLKRKMYAKRKSAANFYQDDEDGNSAGMNFQLRD